MDSIMNVNKEQDFDMQQLMNIVGQNAVISNQSITAINKISEQIGFISTKVTDIENQMVKMTDDIYDLKMNEEITTTQQETIIESAKKRVCEILNHDAWEISKYMRIFIGRLYHDARDCVGLGSKVARTKKCDYQRCIDFIEAWIPKLGCAKLKSIADERARKRLEAKKMGYEI